MPGCVNCTGKTEGKDISGNPIYYKNDCVCNDESVCNTCDDCKWCIDENLNGSCIPSSEYSESNCNYTASTIGGDITNDRYNTQLAMRRSPFDDDTELEKLDEELKEEQIEQSIEDNEDPDNIFQEDVVTMDSTNNIQNTQNTQNTQNILDQDVFPDSDVPVLDSDVVETPKYDTDSNNILGIDFSIFSMSNVTIYFLLIVIIIVVLICIVLVIMSNNKSKTLCSPDFLKQILNKKIADKKELLKSINIKAFNKLPTNIKN